MAKKNVKTVYKVKWKNLSVLLFLFILLGLLIFGGIKVTEYLIDYHETKEIVEKIKTNVKIESTVDDEFIKTFKQSPKLSKFDIYWDYIKLGLIDPDMGALKKMNSDTIGYMEIKGSDFSYPIVQSSDESFYTHNSFLKKENRLGSIYLSKDNTSSVLSTNNIILGNKVYGNYLMGSLNKLFTSTWKDDKNNFIIKYSTSYYSTLWQIISVYHTNNNDHLKTDFNDEEEIKEFADKIVEKSEIRFKTTALESDKFLTITTNSNRSNIVVHAKLIKMREEQ